jgi:hypothetical protein
MGKISDLYYKLTRGKNVPKPNDFGPAVVLKGKCGCGGKCGCNSVESLEKSAGIQKKVSVKIVKATTDSKPSTIPAELKAHLESEGFIKPPVVEEINKKAKTVAKKPVAKVTEKKEAIAKDLADTPAPAKKPVAKKATPSTAKKPAPKKK